MALVLSILNTLILVYLLIRGKYKITITGNKTWYYGIITGFDITLWRVGEYSSTGIVTILIPIRNKRKADIQDEISFINKNPQNKLQILSAKFSWLKTEKQVKQFQKDYSIVDEHIVKKLVDGFVIK